MCMYVVHIYNYMACTHKDPKLHAVYTFISATRVHSVYTCNQTYHNLISNLPSTNYNY